MQQSEDISELAPKLASAALALKNPLATGKAKVATKAGGSYEYRYAELDEIVSDVRATLSEHGLAMLQEALSDSGRVGIVTRITHASGQWIEMGPLWLPAGNTPQEHGSALTYARRYALCAALLLAADEDTDAADVQRTRRPAKTTVPRETEPRDPDAAAPDAPEAPKTPVSDPATKPQVKKLVVLAHKRGWDDDERHARAGVGSFNDLTKARAHELIEAWEALEHPAPAEGNGEAPDYSGIVRQFPEDVQPALLRAIGHFGSPAAVATVYRSQFSRTPRTDAVTAEEFDGLVEMVNGFSPEDVEQYVKECADDLASQEAQA